MRSKPLKESRWYLGPMKHSALENAWAYHMPTEKVMGFKSRKIIGAKGILNGWRLREIERGPKNARLMTLIRLVDRVGLGSNH